jgi:hypothetical protein
MTKRITFKRLTAVGAVCALLVLPTAANAGVADIITLLNTITSTLRNGIGTALSGIHTIQNSVTQLRQQVVWPLAAINQAKTFVGQIRNQFSSLAGQIHQIETSSATLANPSNFEKLLRGKQPGSLSQISASYTQVYPPVAQANQATATQRNLMDMDDAFAIGAIKTAVVSDQASEQMLSVADGIERAASSAAPGTAPMLTAQAQTANLQNQAMLQRMLAAELRQEAARLAHTNTLRKESTQAANDLRNHMQQILGRH